MTVLHALSSTHWSTGTSQKPARFQKHWMDVGIIVYLLPVRIGELWLAAERFPRASHFSDLFLRNCVVLVPAWLQLILLVPRQSSRYPSLLVHKGTSQEEIREFHARTCDIIYLPVTVHLCALSLCATADLVPYFVFRHRECHSEDGGISPTWDSHDCVDPIQWLSRCDQITFYAELYDHDPLRLKVA